MTLKPSMSISTSSSTKREESQGKPPPVTWLSLPNKPQLFILAICRLSEPLSNTCLLPYLYYLIRSLQTQPDVSPASISRQAGLLVSLFALAQFATSVPWAWVANNWGRKPSIMIGLSLSVISNIGFGFSTTVPAVMFWRILAGIGNGNIGVMRTMTAEIVVERKYQSRAFLLLPLVFNSGVVIGLALGGCLADPVDNIPWLVGPDGILNFSRDPQGVQWMRDYPYALPTIFNAGALLCSLLLAIFGLKETAPGKIERRDPGLEAGRVILRIFRRVVLKQQDGGYTAINDEEAEDLMEPYTPKEQVTTPPHTPAPPLMSTKPKLTITSRAIWTREVAVTIISFALLPLHNSAFMQIFPVFLSTPPSPDDANNNNNNSMLIFNGGLGLASPTIGLFLSAFGIFGILIQMLIYPHLQGAIGTLWSYRIALAIFTLAYILAPYLALIPSSSPTHPLAVGDASPPPPQINFIQGAAIASILFLQVTARTFGIPSSVILLTNSAPSPLALAAVHGVGNMLSSLARAVGPALGGVVFAWGMERGVVGLVWWVYLLVVSLVGLGWSWTLREGERPVDRPGPVDREGVMGMGGGRGGREEIELHPRKENDHDDDDDDILSESKAMLDEDYSHENENENENEKVRGERERESEQQRVDVRYNHHRGVS